MGKSKLPGTIVNKSGRLYVVLSQTDLAGNRRRDYHRVPGDTKAAATALQIKLAHDINTGAYVAPTDVTVAEYLERWLKGHRSKIRENTAIGYAGKIRNQINPRIGGQRLQRVDLLMLRGFFQDLVDDGYAHRTIKQTHAVLSRAFADAVESGYLLRSPVPSAPKASAVERAVDRRPVQRAFSAEQLDTLLRATEGTRFHIAWTLMASTGMRREEMCGMLWENVNLDRGLVVVSWIRTTAGGAVLEDWPKTKGSRRVIELDADTVQVLRDWQAQQAAEQEVMGANWLSTVGPECRGHESFHVVADEAGRPYHPDALTKAFKKAVEAAGLPHRRLYDLRHTHATLLLEAGVQPKVVSERMGHSSTSFTQDAYIEVTGTMQRTAVDAFAKLRKR